MKKSKFFLLTLALGAMFLVSWAAPNTANENALKNEVTEIEMTTFTSEFEALYNCPDFGDCFDPDDVPWIIPRIEYCYGWQTGDSPAWCECVDLDGSGAVNVLDLVYLSSNICP